LLFFLARLHVTVDLLDLLSKLQILVLHLVLHQVQQLHQVVELASGLIYIRATFS